MPDPTLTVKFCDAILRAVIGEQIKQTRERRGMSREALAAAVGCSLATIQRLEEGQEYRSLHRLALIAETLDVPLSTLLGLEKSH